MMKSVLNYIAPLLVLVILAGCGRSVQSTGPIDPKNQMEELQEQIINLQNEIADLEIENRRLVDEINDRLEKNEQLRSDLLKLEEHISALESPTNSQETAYTAESIQALKSIFKEANLDAYDFTENLFFMETYQHSTMDFKNFDYTEEMMQKKESLLEFEKRSQDMGIYDDLFEYGAGLIMDAIFPYSSILMIFTEEEETERKSDDLLMEVNFNIDHGKNAGLKQLEFMDEIETYYTLQTGNELKDEDVINFMSSFIEYYENQLSRLSTIYINNEKVDLMTTLFMTRTDNTFAWNEDEEISKTDEKLKQITTSLEKLDDLYSKVKKYQQ